MKKDIKGQLTLDGLLVPTDSKFLIGLCKNCICESCLLKKSGRCECYDEKRAKADPYDKVHPNKPPRTMWSNWEKDGEQAHWCRGGNFFPVQFCNDYIEYKGRKNRHCLKANISEYQDGYIQCSLIENFGCEKCYEEFANQSD